MGGFLFIQSVLLSWSVKARETRFSKWKCVHCFEYCGKQQLKALIAPPELEANPVLEANPELGANLVLEANPVLEVNLVLKLTQS